MFLYVLSHMADGYLWDLTLNMMPEEILMMLAHPVQKVYIIIVKLSGKFSQSEILALCLHLYNLALLES